MCFVQHWLRASSRHFTEVHGADISLLRKDRNTAYIPKLFFLRTQENFSLWSHFVNWKCSSKIIHHEEDGIAALCSTEYSVYRSVFVSHRSIMFLSHLPQYPIGNLHSTMLPWMLLLKLYSASAIHVLLQQINQAIQGCMLWSLHNVVRLWKYLHFSTCGRFSRRNSTQCTFIGTLTTNFCENKWIWHLNVFKILVLNIYFSEGVKCSSGKKSGLHILQRHDCNSWHLFSPLRVLATPQR